MANQRRTPRIVTTVAAIVALAALTEARVTAQEHKGLNTFSLVGFSELRQSDITIEGQLRRGDLFVYESRTNTALPGRSTERLAQYYKGIPVYGADLSRQIDRGVTTSVFGTEFTDIELNTTPGLSVDAARDVFADLAGPAFGLRDDPALWVLPTADGGYALTYRGTLSDLRTVFIDTGTGELLFEFPNSQR